MEKMLGTESMLLHSAFGLRCSIGFAVKRWWDMGLQGIGAGLWEI